MHHLSPILILLALTTATLGKVIDRSISVAAFRKGSCWFYIDRVNLAAGVLEI